MRHVIVGASAAGMAAADAIRKRDPAAEIVMLSSEPRLPYFRPLIPYLIYDGKPASEITRQPHLTPKNIRLRLDVRATSLDPARHILTMVDGTGGSEICAYDRLLLATGASPIRPDIAGIDGPGVFTLRTWEDALFIAEAARGAAGAVVLGAGRIGMKSAFALRHLGLNVTVVELLDRIVPQQLDIASAAIFAEAVAHAGIETILGHSLVKVNRRGHRVTSVVLDDDRKLKADLVVVGVGVRPNLDLAVTGGLRINHGLLVDERLRASAPDVFAAGDVVETNDIVTGESIVSGIWTNAAAMGRIAGDNMAGGDSAYEGAFGLLNAMELGGLPVVSVGDIHRETGDGIEVFAERRGPAPRYRKLVFRGNRLIGLVMVGEIERAGVYQTLIRERADVSALRRELLGPKFHYGHYIHSHPKAADRYVRA
ncbi:MAG: NAD(P)/FAD-dependent oxidoreductase [Chloroflexi bacterium]|nr:NAD(P)/FAD-dependent oxidoreductase [Chloroflexota bacterium]